MSKQLHFIILLLMLSITNICIPLNADAFTPVMVIDTKPTLVKKDKGLKNYLKKKIQRKVKLIKKLSKK